MSTNNSSAPTTTTTNSAQRYDVEVGVWRGHWPTEVQNVVALSSRRIARYLSGRNVLEVVGCDLEGGGGAEEEEEGPTQVCASYCLDEHCTGISSLHHYTAEGSDDHFLLCPLNCKKKFVLLRVTETAKGKDDEDKKVDDNDDAPMIKLVSSGEFSTPVTHLVIFRYRSLPYCLCYCGDRGGNYSIFQLTTVAGTDDSSLPQQEKKEDLNILSTGYFSTGWTDVIWKGTHHVRCTRQKFFCYNANTGESAFECVYIKGASGSSSVCSAEHIRQIQTKNEDQKAVECALRKKHQLVVPLRIGDVALCLLYSHSRADPQIRDVSSGLLPQHTSAPRRGVSQISDSAVLLMQKKIFAHEEPWTHFCAVGTTECTQLLCYSARSGVIWSSRLRETAEPVEAVKIVGEKALTLTRDAVEQLTHHPICIDSYTSAVHPSEGGGDREEEDHISAATTAKPSTVDSNQHESAAANLGGDRRRSGSHRRREIRAVLARIQRGEGHTNRQEEVEKLILMLGEDDGLNNNNNDSEYIAAALAQLHGATGTSALTPSPPPKSPHGKEPWKCVAGYNEVPAPAHGWYRAFHQMYQERLTELAKVKKMDDATVERLTRIIETRDAFQKRMIGKYHATLLGASVDAKADKTHVTHTIKKLSVDDVQLRKKKLDKIKEKHEFHPAPPLRLQEEEITDQCRHLSDDAVALREKKMDKIRQHLQATAPSNTQLNSSPKLKKVQQSNLLHRLIDESQHRRAMEKQRVLVEMDGPSRRDNNGRSQQHQAPLVQ